jgi:DNA-binding transcriptional LysR family regulator
MGIDRLRYFAAVVETKNLRRASELVGIAPPSMSKAIAVLENDLGHKLIHHEGRGIGITPKGIEVYKLSIPLLDEHRRFYQSLKKNDENPPQIRMATFEVFSTYFVSSFLSNEKHFDFFLLEMTPGKIEKAISTGIVDFGITYLPAPNPSLEYIEIGSFEMGVFGRKEWEGISFEKLPFAIPITELTIHSSEIDALDLWPRNAPKRTIKYHFELLETALQTSREGLSVLHCPDFIIKIHNEQMKQNFQLHSLLAPTGYKKLKPIKCYLVGKKGVPTLKLEGKLAKFMRSLK